MGIPLRVLLVEDNPYDADILVGELKRAGWAPDWARVDTEREYVAALDQDWAVMFADYHLPQLDIASILTALHDSGKDIPVIVVTGALGDEAAAECIRLGATDYMLKDRLARLGQAVENAMVGRWLRTEKTEAQRALRESEERLSLVLEGSGHSTWDLDVADQRFHRSGRWGEMTGIEPVDRFVTVDEWLQSVHVDDRGPLKRALMGHLSGELPFYHAEYRVRHTRGDWVWVQDRGRVVSWDGPTRAAGTSADITSAKATEERLQESFEQTQALARHLQSVREEERAHIAREVHDELGQGLTGLKLDVGFLMHKVSKSVDGELRETLIEKMEGMVELINTTIQTVRKIATELRPAVLDTFGLVPAIEWQARDFEQRTGVKCELDSDVESLDLDRDRSTALFRVFQEALTNVMRHAKASAVTARLCAEDGEVRLCVEDDGVGITDERLAGRGSFGLMGMRERAVIFGGEVSIARRAEGGTRVVIRMPIPVGSES